MQMLYYYHYCFIAFHQRFTQFNQMIIVHREFSTVFANQAAKVVEGTVWSST